MGLWEEMLQVPSLNIRQDAGDEVMGSDDDESEDNGDSAGGDDGGNHGGDEDNSDVDGCDGVKDDDTFAKDDGDGVHSHDVKDDDDNNNMIHITLLLSSLDLTSVSYHVRVSCCPTVRPGVMAVASQYKHQRNILKFLI